MNFKQSMYFLLQKRCFSSKSAFKQNNKNHYESLGVQKNATQADVKSAYYELSKMYHPDKNQGCDESSRKFREVNEAYEVLGNVKTRRLYDKGLYVNPHIHTTTHDPMGKFYQSRDIRARPPPPTGRTPIYDFDEWSRSHYGATFERTQQVKHRRQWQKEQKEKSENVAKLEALVVCMMVLAFASVYIFANKQDRYDTITIVAGSPVVHPKNQPEAD